MEATSWDELEELFERTLALPPEQRTAFLDEACGNDTDRRAELRSLLDLYADASSYFEDLQGILSEAAKETFQEKPPPATPPPPLSQNLVGTMLSHYEVLEHLGTGGMGVVYRAQDTRLGRMVAIKVLLPNLNADDRAKQRFISEARAASALDHPNICTIHEFGESEQSELFMVMACYTGETLKKKISRGPLPLDEALDYARQIAQGLAKAHAAEIVHRDVKPANVMITDDAMVKILDFGLAKMADTHLTKTGTTMGTVAYVSPEQARGEPVDRRTDIWSLGVVLYEMLTGQRPFRGSHEQAIVYSILHEEPEPPSKPTLPPALQHVLTRCLEKDLLLRYATISELQSDLEILPEGTPEDRHGRSHRDEKRWRWTPRSILIGVGALAALLLALSPVRTWLTTTWKGQPDPPQAVQENPRLTSPGAREFHLRGRDLLHRSEEEEDPAQLVRAIELFLRALQEDPAYALAHADLGKAYLQKYTDTRDIQWIEKAEASSTRAIELNDQLAPVFVTLGLIENSNGQYGKAKVFFQQAIDWDSANADAYRGLARTFEEVEEDFEDVEALYGRAINIKPEDWRGYLDLGLFYARRGRQQEALQQFEKVEALAPNNVKALRILGGIHYLLNHFNEAIEAWEQALEVKENAKVYSNLGTLYYFKLQDFEGAALMYEKALALQDTDYMLWEFLGAAYFQAGRRAEAEVAWREQIKRAEEMLAVNERDVQVLARLALAHARLKEPEQARSYIQRTRSEAPQEYSPLFLISIAYEILGDRENALVWIAQALENGLPPPIVEEDPWLQGLLADPDYQQLLPQSETF